MDYYRQAQFQNCFILGAGSIISHGNIFTSFQVDQNMINVISPIQNPTCSGNCGYSALNFRNTSLLGGYQVSLLRTAAD